ncbi:MAG: lamin tail domain-containing protein [Bacillota bacterium]
MSPRVEIAGVFSGVDESDPRSLSVDEFVVLVNTGAEPAQLAGWSLSKLKTDQRHHFRYIFPRFMSNGESWVLEPGGMVILYTGRGTNGATATEGEAHQYHLYQHRSAPIWVDPGDRVCLQDRTGRVMATLDLPVAPRRAN